jgi:hypothetical protein
MILALTISISAIWLPIIPTIVCFIFGLIIINDAAHGGYFGGDMVQVIGVMLLIIGIPFIWTIYSTVLYFLK